MWCHRPGIHLFFAVLALRQLDGWLTLVFFKLLGLLNEAHWNHLLPDVIRIYHQAAISACSR